MCLTHITWTIRDNQYHTITTQQAADRVSVGAMGTQARRRLSDRCRHALRQPHTGSDPTKVHHIPPRCNQLHHCKMCNGSVANKRAQRSSKTIPPLCRAHAAAHAPQRCGRRQRRAAAARLRRKCDKIAAARHSESTANQTAHSPHVPLLSTSSSPPQMPSQPTNESRAPFSDVPRRHFTQTKTRPHLRIAKRSAVGSGHTGTECRWMQRLFSL